MLNNLKKYKVILASGSPRRRELLSGLGIDYTIKVLPDVNEAYPETLKGEDIPLYIAREKAEAYLKGIESDELIITAGDFLFTSRTRLNRLNLEAMGRSNIMRTPTMHHNPYEYFLGHFRKRIRTASTARITTATIPFRCRNDKKMPPAFSIMCYPSLCSSIIFLSIFASFLEIFLPPRNAVIKPGRDPSNVRSTK